MSVDENDFIEHESCKNEDCTHYSQGGCMFQYGCIYFTEEQNEQERKDFESNQWW